MTMTAKKPKDLYEADFYVWTQQQASSLRQLLANRANLPLDLENLAEEVEALGRSERSAARSQLRRIIDHCLKLEYSPAPEPRAKWRSSVREARARLEDDLTPSLLNDLRTELDRLYCVARRNSTDQMRSEGEGDAAARIPEQCPFTIEHLLAEEWFPANRFGLTD